MLQGCVHHDSYTVQVWKQRLTTDYYKASYDTIGKTSNSKYFDNVHSIETSLTAWFYGENELNTLENIKITKIDTICIRTGNVKTQLFNIVFDFGELESCNTLFSSEYGILKINFIGHSQYKVEKYDIINGKTTNQLNFISLIDSALSQIYIKPEQADTIKIIEVE
jgi:hypothetical protein